ncbi:HNH endonuclease [Shewanella avicenniae]|uniref:HNH endonuclease n=1 Tax=Shewanella avicenniae TaxID=2814294 RepID=A0ABX7QN70_9GAMM|nr:HNH endonuclease family protein [Shewanella avicenniae]QSX32467.1 HNH endonuclease [Shewanella avicenniae]
MRIFLSIVLLAASLLAYPAHALIKKSNSGICHDESSQYFDKTKHFTPYQTLDDCLSSGGRLPKGYVPKAMSVYQPTAKHSVDSGYSRDKFGKGWADVDHDGQDTRQEILISQNTGNLVFNDKGRVTRGRWVSMYSGNVIVNASEVDIDHIVPLSWAWKHGADKWTQAERETFANDQRNLVAVEASLNRQKGDKGLDEWLPPTNQQQYKLRFERIAKIYNLRN